MRWHHPAGTLRQQAAGPEGPFTWDVAVTSELDGWRYTTLRVATLDAGGSAWLEAPDEELVVVPLQGGFEVELRDASGEGSADASATRHRLTGRASVFAGPTDVLAVPPGRHLRVSSERGGRVAVCGAYVDASGTRRPAGQGAGLGVVRLDAHDVPVELRGAGSASREVRNVGLPGVLDAERLIVCEVLTPAGGWSSYPPHKHDEERPGLETELEEVYYLEVRPEDGGPGVSGATSASHASGTPDPVGYLRVHDRTRDPAAHVVEVRSGDVVLVPHGWHGPAMAPPGYDLYYLNVMAGPGPERAWLVTDHPGHAWVRDTWAGRPVDPRLPFGGAR